MLKSILLTLLVLALGFGACREGEPEQAKQTPPGAPPGVGPCAPISKRERDKRMEAATVLIRTSTGHGSGFFVTDVHVVTNRHVVENEQRVLVYASWEDGPLAAEVLAKTPSGEPSQRDYAVLRVLTAKRGPHRLPLGALPRRQDTVWSSGFPGVVCKSDAGCRRGGHAPTVVVRKGIVSAVVDSPGDPSLKLISHEAQTSPGNSGGPLVDACGRVVGIASYVSTGKGGGKGNFALSAPDLYRFLRRHETRKIRYDRRRCL